MNSQMGRLCFIMDAHLAAIKAADLMENKAGVMIANKARVSML